MPHGTRDDPRFHGEYRHPVEPELDTAQEQAHALLVGLRDSFAPTYLTLISIIQGVLLGLMFQLLWGGGQELRTAGPTMVLAFNNVVVIVLVWNEYRMGSYMFRWVPYLLDAVIPFVIGALQAGLLLAMVRPVAWIGWLATFYLASVIAFENMYRRSAEEQRNAFVLERNRRFRRLNTAACLGISLLLWALYAVHAFGDATPGRATWLLVTAINLAFLVRGEVNWRHIVAAARRAGAPVRTGPG
jgi:hypothetical protein